MQHLDPITHERDSHEHLTICAQQLLTHNLTCNRWSKMKLARTLHAWWGETERGSEVGKGREELLSLLSEQQVCVCVYVYVCLYVVLSLCMARKGHLLAQWCLTCTHIFIHACIYIQAMNKAHEETISRYKDLHNKAEQGMTSSWPSSDCMLVWTCVCGIWQGESHCTCICTRMFVCVYIFTHNTITHL
jgi:hypothetical protein